MGARVRKARRATASQGETLDADFRPKVGVILEGMAAVLWHSQDETAEFFRVDVRTVTSWRRMGLPSYRAANGTRWYAWPHSHIWRMCLIDWRQGGKNRIDRVPFAVAVARNAYDNAAGDAGVAYPARVFNAPEGAPGSESYR
ncbi:MAG TPA: hypothetical protein PKA66_07390 [Gemmatimonadales bacterium]|nr:hypothetical protein [Gemmatimonadales bacterium]